MKREASNIKKFQVDQQFINVAIVTTKSRFKVNTVDSSLVKVMTAPC